MTTEAPIWWGLERGTDLSELMEEIDDDEELAEGAAGGNDVAAGLLGLALPLVVIALTIAAGVLPVWAMAVLSLVGAAWLAAGAAAAWLVAFDEEAPPWAVATVAVIVGIGRLIAWATLIAAALMLVGMLAAFLWDRR